MRVFMIHRKNIKYLVLCVALAVALVVVMLISLLQNPYPLRRGTTPIGGSAQQEGKPRW